MTQAAEPDSTTQPNAPTASLMALWFAMLWPTVVTYLYFDLLHGRDPAWQSSVAGVGKLLQFAFPLAYVLWKGRRWVRWQKPSPNGLLVGAVFGIAVAMAMFGMYWGWLKHSDQFVSAADQIREKISSLGWITGPVPYIALGTFYALCHSLLEEYYWRWFVFVEWKGYVRTWSAVLLSSMGFMLHHVLLLAFYFGWNSWLTYFCSAGVAVGGIAWAWLFQRSKSLYGPWLSHLLVDAAIFVIGFDVIRDTF